MESKASTKSTLWLKGWLMIFVAGLMFYFLFRHVHRRP